HAGKPLLRLRLRVGLTRVIEIVFAVLLDAGAARVRRVRVEIAFAALARLQLTVLRVVVFVLQVAGDERRASRREGTDDHDRDDARRVHQKLPVAPSDAPFGVGATPTWIVAGTSSVPTNEATVRPSAASDTIAQRRAFAALSL